MSQASTKLALAGTMSNVKDVETFAVDPATFLAGLCLSMGSDGLPSLLKSAGMRLGVSLGRSLADFKNTSVARTGLKVGIRAHLKRATGIITISSYANLVSGTDDAVTIAGTAFTAQAGAATPGDATFQAATNNNTTAVSLAAQINAHATVSLKVYAVVTSSGVVTLYSVADGVGSTGTGNDIAVSYTDNDTNVGIVLSGLSGGKMSGGSDTISDIAYAVDGAKMYINDVTGKADIAMSGFSTVSDAVYRNANSLPGADPGPVFTGIAEDDSEVAAVLVDMQGGL